MIDIKHALKGLFSEYLKETDTVSYSFFYPEPGHLFYGKYDCQAKQIDKQNGSTKRKLLFIATVFTSVHEVPMVETSKIGEWNKLITTAPPSKIYLVFFTPKKTMIYDLEKLKQENKITYLDDISYLDAADSKQMEYVYVPPGETTLPVPEDPFPPFTADPIPEEENHALEQKIVKPKKAEKKGPAASATKSSKKKVSKPRKSTKR